MSILTATNGPAYYYLGYRGASGYARGYGYRGF